jgi:hypothetical protein
LFCRLWLLCAVLLLGLTHGMRRKKCDIICMRAPGHGDQGFRLKATTVSGG